MPRIPFKPRIIPHREMQLPTIPNRIKTPLDLFDNPVTGPDPDPIPKPKGRAPKAMPDDPLGEFTLDLDPGGRFSPPDDPSLPPIDAVQRMLGLSEPEIPHGPITKPLPSLRPTPRTTMPDPYRRWNDGLPTNEFMAAERNRDLPMTGRASDVADPLSPVDPGEGESTFNRAYVPGDIERMLIQGLPDEVQTEATDKLTSLAGRMGQDEYIRLTQELDHPQDSTGADLLDTINSALSLTSPDPNPRPALGGAKASLPIDAINLDTEIPGPANTLEWRQAQQQKAATASPTKRIKRQYVGTPRTEGTGSLREDIGRAVKETPWGDYRLSFAENPMGRETAVNVGDFVEAAGSPTRGRILGITGGTKKIDTRQAKAISKGQQNMTGSMADDLDFSDMDYVTTQINAKLPLRGKKTGEVDENGKPIYSDPQPYIQRKEALKPQMARVEFADGSIKDVPLARVKRVSSAPSVDDPWVRGDVADLQRILRNPAADVETLYRERAKDLPDEVNPLVKGGKPAGNPAASKNAFFQLGRDYPTAGGKYRVRHMDGKGKPIAREGKAAGEWFDMGIDEALRKGIITEKPKARRPNAVVGLEDEKKLQKIGNAAKLAKHGTKEGAIGGMWAEPPEVGSVHRVVDGKDHLLVQVDEVLPRADRKIDVKWTPKAKLEGSKWVKLGVAGAVGAGGFLASEDEAEAARLPNTKVSTAIRAQQNAPRVEVPTVGKWSRFKREVTNRTDLVEHGGTKLENRFGTQEIDPETNPRSTHPLYLRGGLAPAEEEFKNLHEAIAPAGKDLIGHLEDMLNLRAYDSAINVVDEKGKRAAGLSAKAYAEGDEEAGLQHAKTANTYQQKIADKKVVPLGYDKDAIARDIAEVESTMSPEELARVRKAEQGVFAITRKLLNEARKEGIISDEQFQFYANRGDRYLPMYRLAEMFDPETGVLIKNKYLEGGEDFRANQARASLLDDNVVDIALEGSEKTNVHPLVGVVQYIDGLIGEIQRNKAAKSALTFYETHQPKIQQMIAEGDEGMKHFLLKRLGNTKPPGEAPPGRAYIGFMEKGKPIYFDVDADFGTAMTHIDPEITRGAAALMGKTRLFMHMGVASAFPPFMLTQVVKDPVAALVKPQYSKYSNNALTPDLIKTFLPRFAKDVLAGYIVKPAEAVGIAPAGSTAKLKAGKYSAEPERALATSGSVNAYTDPKEEVMGFKRGVWDQESSMAKKLVRAAMAGGQKMIQLGLQPLEEATKHASYDTMRTRGFGPIEAGTQTRKFGGSPDFNMVGNTTDKFKNEVMFINPWMTGLSSTLESMKTDPTKFAKLATLAGMGMAYVYNHNSQFIGEDGVPELKKVHPSDKAGNIIWFYGEPEVTANGDKRYPYLKIPIAHELALLMSPAIAAMNASEDPNYSAAQGVADVASHFIPGGAPIDASSPGDLVKSLGRRGVASLNPLLKVPLELGTGTEMLSNTPIIGSRVGGMLPEYQQTLRTPPGAVALAEQLGTSPDMTAYLLKNALPGLAGLGGEIAGEIMGTPERLTAPLESPTESILRAPVVGQFARRFQGTMSSNAEIGRQREIFYSFKDRTQSAANTVSGLGGRNPWELQSLSSNDRMLAAFNPTMTKFQLALSEIDKTRELLIRNAAMPVEEKKAALQRLFQAESKIMTATEGFIQRIQGTGVQ